jgi:hypothetical protein
LGYFSYFWLLLIFWATFDILGYFSYFWLLLKFWATFSILGDS